MIEKKMAQGMYISLILKETVTSRSEPFILLSKYHIAEIEYSVDRHEITAGSLCRVPIHVYLMALKSKSAVEYSTSYDI